jgi:prepilin signal peptidase PulO-like enzyme (type II secretory pathway)
VILVWFITSQPDAWLARQNVYGLFIILGMVVLIDLTRYIFPDPLLTATLPPRFGIVLIFIVAVAIAILIITRLSRAYTWIVSITIILLIVVLLILKSPQLSLQTSIFIRELTRRSAESASASDLRWLGFSYIAFRLIHVLRDKELGRLRNLCSVLPVTFCRPH